MILSAARYVLWVVCEMLCGLLMMIPEGGPTMLYAKSCSHQHGGRCLSCRAVLSTFSNNAHKIPDRNVAQAVSTEEAAVYV